MTSINIGDPDPAAVNGKTAIITGGSSGIGLAAAVLLAERGARVFLFDLVAPEDLNSASWPSSIKYIKCDVTSWSQLQSAFQQVDQLDFVFSNAGIGEKQSYFTETLDDKGQLMEPSAELLDIDLRGHLNVIKLAWYHLKKQGSKGSIVVTTSGTGLVQWQSLAVYSSIKLALVGVIRSLRSLMILDGITINGVAPSATLTPFIPAHLVEPVKAAGAPVSTARQAALALIYSAIATQPRRVEAYGKDKDSEDEESGRWNGRVILILGDKYTEVEETYANLRSTWLGRENARLYRIQQAATDTRNI